MTVKIEFDNEKNALNKPKHGIPLEFAALLFEGEYKEEIDDREDSAKRGELPSGQSQIVYVSVPTRGGKRSAA